MPKTPEPPSREAADISHADIISGDDKERRRASKMLRAGLAVASLLVVTGCGQHSGMVKQPVDSGFVKLCSIERPNAAPMLYIGPDGRTVPADSSQCAQANESTRRSGPEIKQTRVDEEQLRAQRQQEERARAKTALGEIINKERALGYDTKTVTDLILDGKLLAGKQAKVSVKGFYKLYGQRDQRFYISYRDFMLHTYQPIEARYIGLVTADGSRRLREYLLRCAAGCELIILGRVASCIETSGFGSNRTDFCLAADDMRATEDGT